MTSTSLVYIWPFLCVFQIHCFIQTKEKSLYQLSMITSSSIPSPSHTKALCSLKLTWLSPWWSIWRFYYKEVMHIWRNKNPMKNFLIIYSLEFWELLLIKKHNIGVEHQFCCSEFCKYKVGLLGLIPLHWV